MRGPGEARVLTAKEVSLPSGLELTVVEGVDRSEDLFFVRATRDTRQGLWIHA